MHSFVVVPWHNPEQLKRFLAAWKIGAVPEWLILVQDKNHEGCAKTKNRGIRMARERDAEMICILDDDCYPAGNDLASHVRAHELSLMQREVELYNPVSDPPTRGTPYFSRTAFLTVAASIGSVTGVPDYDAVTQLSRQGAERKQDTGYRHGRYFPMCGMNIAFRTWEFPWCQFIDVPRFDDIWMGYLWQKHAYAENKCFSLNGPLVTHARQSNVWKNLQIEAQNMEKNEVLWQQIFFGPLLPYEEMLSRYSLSL